MPLLLQRLVAHRLLSGCSIGIDCVYPAYPTHPSPDETVISTTTIGPSLSTSSTKFSSTTVVASTSILVSTSAAAPSSTPNSGPLLSDGWVSSYPCSVDPPSHVFNPPDVHQLSDNTPKSCTKFCDDRGYYFAGVMNGNECQCGNRYMGDVDPDAAPPAECESKYMTRLASTRNSSRFKCLARATVPSCAAQEDGSCSTRRRVQSKGRHTLPAGVGMPGAWQTPPAMVCLWTLSRSRCPTRTLLQLHVSRAVPRVDSKWQE
jgi:hypothetical protein